MCIHNNKCNLTCISIFIVNHNKYVGPNMWSNFICGSMAFKVSLGSKVNFVEFQNVTTNNYGYVAVTHNVINIWCGPDGHTIIFCIKIFILSNCGFHYHCSRHQVRSIHKNQNSIFKSHKMESGFRFVDICLNNLWTSNRRFYFRL